MWQLNYSRRLSSVICQSQSKHPEFVSCSIPCDTWIILCSFLRLFFYFEARTTGLYWPRDHVRNEWCYLTLFNYIFTSWQIRTVSILIEVTWEKNNSTCLFSLIATLQDKQMEPSPWVKLYGDWIILPGLFPLSSHFKVRIQSSSRDRSHSINE
jgi:hypothetical protein